MTKILSFRCLHPYPRTCPHGGDTLRFEIPLCSQSFCRGFALVLHPRLRSVLWLARPVVKWTAALAKNLPHRSRENEFTDGRVGRFSSKTDDMSFTSLTGSTSGRRERYPLPCPRLVQTGCAIMAHEFERVSCQRLVLFSPFGVSSSPPLPPSSGHPSVVSHRETLAADGRASRRGLSSKYSETRPRSLIRPNEL